MLSSKSVFFAFTALLLNLLLIVGSTPLENVEEDAVEKAQVKANPIPLYRYYNSGNGDHFYTTNINELGPNGRGGYVSEGIAGRCYASHEPNTVAFLRYYNGGNGDHFYTTDFGELGCGRGGYVSEGIACYVYVQRNSGTVPFYRYYNRGNGDHFYTTNINELGPNGKGGYISEGIAAYIYPS